VLFGVSKRRCARISELRVSLLLAYASRRSASASMRAAPRSVRVVLRWPRLSVTRRGTSSKRPAERSVDHRGLPKNTGRTRSLASSAPYPYVTVT
jgi:hypothetical protein